MLKVGITGAIGSGKSIVCKIFSTLGVPVYNADDRAKWILENDTGVVEAVTELLGDEAYMDRRAQRAWIAEEVFKDKEKLNALNQIIHPAVGLDFEQWVANQDAEYVLKEAALLYESGSNKNLDSIICVVAPKSLRIQRVMRRDGVTREEVESRMRNQMPQEEKQNLSDHQVINDDQVMVLPQVLELHRHLCQ